MLSALLTKLGAKSFWSLTYKKAKMNLDLKSAEANHVAT